jgi:hypothetical protein
MAISKKSGLRQIKVGPVIYYWKVKTDYDTRQIKISIGEVENQNKRVLIESYHVDAWLAFGDKSLRKNQVEAVTPHFIKQAITFAHAQQWNDMENKVLHLGYENQEFYIKKKE